MTHNELQALIQEIAGIMGNDKLFNASPSDLSYGQATSAWSALNLLKKNVIDPRLAGLRDKLFAEAEARGEENKNGSFIFKMPNLEAEIMKQRKQKKTTFPLGKLKEVLAEKSDVLKMVLTTSVSLTMENYKRLMAVIRYAEMQAEKEGNTRVVNAVAKLRDVLDMDPKYAVDTKALEGLHAAGKVSKGEMGAVGVEGKVEWALKVKEPRDIVALFPPAPKKSKN